jgi:hypothetical protein
MCEITEAAVELKTMDGTAGRARYGAARFKCTTCVHCFLYPSSGEQYTGTFCVYLGRSLAVCFCFQTSYIDPVFWVGSLVEVK